MKNLHLKYIVLSLFLYIVATMQVQSQQPLNLKDYRWKNRLILLFAETMKSSEYKEQLQLLKDQLDGLEERDLMVFSFFANKSGDANGNSLLRQDVEKIRKEYNVKSSDQLLILIGKDGGEKLRAPLPTEINKVYGLIDRMPMRRQEMRESRH